MPTDLLPSADEIRLCRYITAAVTQLKKRRVRPRTNTGFYIGKGFLSCAVRTLRRLAEFLMPLLRFTLETCLIWQKGLSGGLPTRRVLVTLTVKLWHSARQTRKSIHCVTSAIKIL